MVASFSLHHCAMHQPVTAVHLVSVAVLVGSTAESQKSLRWKGPQRSSHSDSPAKGRDTFHQTGLLRICRSGGRVITRNLNYSFKYFAASVCSTGTAEVEDKLLLFNFKGNIYLVLFMNICQVSAHLLQVSNHCSILFFFFQIIDLMINKVIKMVENAELLCLGEICGSLTKLPKRR